MATNTEVLRTRLKLFKLVFKRLRPKIYGKTGSVKCQLCKVTIHFRKGSPKELKRHIRNKHKSLLLATCFNNITPVQWLKLFKYVKPDQEGVQFKFVKCKYCEEQFEHVYSQQKHMLNHLKAMHPYALLTVWNW